MCLDKGKIMTTKKTKKRNPADLTGRNLKAAKKREARPLEYLLAFIQSLEDICSHFRQRMKPKRKKGKK